MCVYDLCVRTFVCVYVGLFIYRVQQEESAIRRENVFQVNLHRYNQTYCFRNRTVAEIMSGAKCGLLAVPRTVPV